MKPLFCNYFLTLKCELACDFCPFWARYDDYPEEAPLAGTLKNLEILTAAGVKFLNFSGCDPLLYPDFPEVLKKAKDLKMKVSVSTSGIHYPELAEKIRGQIDFLCFDLGGHNQETTTNAAGFDFFDKITSAIRLSKKLREKSFIKLVLNRDNVLALQEAVELAVSLRTPLILRPSYKNEDLSNFQKETFSYIRRYFNHPAVFLNLAIFEFQKKIQTGKFSPNKICRAGQYVLTVLPGGELAYPCFYRPAYKIRLGSENECFPFLSGFPRKENLSAVPECEVCRDWDYFEPSFFYGLNRYNWFNINSWGKYYLKRTFSPFFK